MSNPLIYLALFIFLAFNSAYSTPLCKDSTQQRNFKVTYNKHKQMHSLTGSIGQTDVIIFNRSYNLFNEPNQKADQLLESEMNIIFDIIKNTQAKFPQMSWPKKLYVQYTNHAGDTSSGGPNWISINRGVIDIERTHLTFKQTMEPLIVHELGHTFVTQGFLKKIGKLEVSEQMALKWFDKGKDFVVLNMSEGPLMLKLGEFRKNYILSFFLQEMSSDLLTSLYYKNHDVLTEYFNLLKKYMTDYEASNSSLNFREVNSGDGQAASLKIVSTTLHNFVKNLYKDSIVYSTYKKAKNKILAEVIKRKIELSGMSQAEYLKQNPDVVEKFHANNYPANIETMNLYNYLDQIRVFLVTNGYYLKAIKEGKEQVLMQAVQEAIIEVSIGSKSANDNLEVLNLNLLKDIFTNNYNMEQAITNKLEELNF